MKPIDTTRLLEEIRSVDHEAQMTDVERARQLVEEGHTLLPAADPEDDGQGFLAVHLVDGQESSEIVRLSRDELQRLRDEFDSLHPQTG